jgi:hypothetical protein
VPELAAGLEELVRRMVDRPEDVELEASEEGGTTVFELHLDPEDLGKVIGRQGRTAAALRTLLDARGALDGTRYDLDILD